MRQFSLTRPTPQWIDTFLQASASLDFTGATPGCTAEDRCPPGYVRDHYRVRLGRGDACFMTACAAVRRWQMLALGWVWPYRRDTPIEAGRTVVVNAAVPWASPALFWISNAARIVYVIDAADRFGFAYNTLPNHVEQGEERFLIERDASGEVFYDILAFSRPQHWLAKIGYLFVRTQQRRFARGSLAAMVQSCAAP